MTAELADFTDLEPGQTLRIAVSPGFAVRVVEGSVQLVPPPSWLGDTVFSARATLHTEEVHVIERRGWIEIVALSPARVQSLPQAVPVNYGNRTRLWRPTQFLIGMLAALRIR